MLNKSRLWKLVLAALWASLAVGISASGNPDPARKPEEKPPAKAAKAPKGPSDAERQKQTVADIRNAGTAMFSWLTDQVGAGAAGEDVVDIAQYPAISRDELREILVPTYIHEVPEKDGWGHPYEYYLSVKEPTAEKVMCIRSPGRDGTFSNTAYDVGNFDPEDFDQDIVWCDGFFGRWPQKKSG
ncbi:MAG TPA: hypothetical protein VMW27_29710 [Thermoanaerobaculia bacterium]|nr:hypothetical protein [Thermoanaerobaculia bacterium]